MEFLLRLKHWQLFLATWGLPIFISLYTVSNPTLIFTLFPLMVIFFIFGLFGWVWAIATGLQSKLPAGVKLNVGLFRILILVPSLYTIALVLWAMFGAYRGSDVIDDDSVKMIGISIVIVHLFSMLCIVLSVRFAAKTLKSVELGRLAKFNDYIGEFFMIWMSPVGIWILQPRLNKLMES